MNVPKLNEKTRSRVKNSVVIVAMAVALVGAWEGLRTKVYRDAVGVPTICYGETRGITMRTAPKSVAKCKEMLGDGLVDFELGIRKCLKRPDQIPDKSYTAFISLAYNIGRHGFCRSSVARHLNAEPKPNVTRACQRIKAFNKAGGRVLSGLVRRRNEEYRLCMEGVREGVVTGIVTGDDQGYDPPTKFNR
jgi:lysozyme